jgi:hypothetical protein
MRSFLWYALIAVALLAGALFVACGSDSDDNGDADADEPTAEQTIDGDNGSSDDSDGSGDSGDFRAFAERFGISEVKVEYNFTSFDAAEDFEGTMTLYSKPPDKWRMDIGAPDGDIAMINDGDATFMCASEGGEGQCFESPINDAIGIPFFSIFTDPDEFDNLVDISPGVDVNESSREIAGQDATCFEVSGTIDNEEGEAEYCFRDDGVLLLVRASGSTNDGGGEFSMEATSVSDSVSDEDFEPIYDVLDIGGIVP